MKTGIEKLTGVDRKLGELILYISRKCEEDNRYGATKLNKILFYSDFIHYGKTGKSITGAGYQRLRWGPAPRRLVPVREELLKSGALVVQEKEYLGRPQQRPLALRDADLSEFTGAEIAVVDETIEALWNANANDVSDFSHRFPGWKIAEKGEEIPYETVFLADRMLTQAEKDYALELI